MMTVGSLFSGIGGFDLGLERAGMQVKWQCEKDPWARKVLAKHWPGVPCHENIATLQPEAVEHVDVLAGGFPCQDLSIAGKRAGLREGTRSGLWGEFARLIRGIRPKYVLVENVPGILANHALGRVLGDLAECGYNAEWNCLSASRFGGAHARDRIWIVAYPVSIGWDPSKNEIFINREGLPLERGADALRWMAENARSGVSTIPSNVRNGNGLPHFMDRLRGLGNAVVPQIVEAIGEMIVEVEGRNK